MSKIVIWAIGVFVLFVILARILRKLKVAFAISLLLGVWGLRPLHLERTFHREGQGRGTSPEGRNKGHLA